MNISCFAYRDINRNGSYDLGDRPYAGLIVSMKKPDDSDLIRKSNIGGFANFKMSLNNDVYPISTPGRYQIKVESPRGWEITSDNNNQILNIRQHPGSPAGLVAEQTLQPVGVAPALTIFGTVNREQWGKNDDITIKIGRADDESIESRADSEGGFSVPVSKGTWHVEISNASGATHNRIIDVDRYAVRLSGISIDSDTISGISIDSGTMAIDYPEHAIDFHDLTYSDTLFEIPNGFGDLQWHNWISTHQKLYRGAGYINATTSGEYLAYNSSGHPASISSDQPFDLVQANIGVAWSEAEQGDITITAWRQDQIAYKDVLRGSTAGPVVFAADYLGVTKIEFSTEHYWQLVMDDLVIRH